MNKYAVLSTDNNPDYYNLLPLVCYSWRKIGYTPIIIFVNVPEERRDRIMAACPGAKRTVLDGNEGIKDSTVAQIQRLFEYVKCKDDDILITADADMVIAKDIFTHDVSQGQIVSYGYDLTGRSEIPICYVKGAAGKWRELMGDCHMPEKAFSDKWEDFWSVDQQLLTQRAREYGMDRINLVDRGNNGPGGLPTGRWDRHGWIKPAEIIDVHMKRNDWAAQFEVFHALWPGEDDTFLHNYRAAIEGKETPKTELAKITANDPHGFLQNIGGNWDNHRPLLLLSLSLTKGLVIEFGAGDGSTPYLRKYCEGDGRIFETWESNKEWADKTGANYTSSWDIPSVYRECGVFFCDHAPGEHRRVAVERMADRADVIVVHDTEQDGAGDYQFEPVFAKFKYRLNYNKNGGGAAATALSNTIDLNRFRGLSLGQYTFDND